MSRRRASGIKTIATTVALALAALITRPASAIVIDMYDGLTADYNPVNAFFTGLGSPVTPITAGFTASDIAGADFVILSEPQFTLTGGQLLALDNYVNGGGRLLINSEFSAFAPAAITETNAILLSLASSIVNLSTASNPGFHDTSDIVSNPLTAGVTDVNYADTSSLSTLTGGTALVFGNPSTDSGQEFIAFQSIQSGCVYVIGDSNTADHINSTSTNNNGVLYNNFATLSCGPGTVSTVPEPSSLILVGSGLISIVLRRRRLTGRASTR